MNRFKFLLFKFALPKSWNDVSADQALALRGSNDTFSVLSILSGVDKKQLSVELDECDVDALIVGFLGFISDIPDFALLPVPKAINIPRRRLWRPIRHLDRKLPKLGLGYRRINADIKIGSKTTIAQKWDVDHAIDALTPKPDEYGEYPDQPEPGLLDLAQTLLSIYLAPRVNNRPYEGDQDAADCWDAIKHLPCTTLLPLAGFFLSRHYQKTRSGRLFIRPTPFPSSLNTN